MASISVCLTKSPLLLDYADAFDGILLSYWIALDLTDVILDYGYVVARDVNYFDDNMRLASSTVLVFVCWDYLGSIAVSDAEI